LRHRIFYCIGVALLSLGSTAHASTFTFDQDPFAGTNVLNAPGRQIVGGEDFLSFTPSRDVFSFDPAAFDVASLNFVNASAANIPASGVNVVVLETFDDDNNPLTPFGAGNAANLIADEITTPGPGFFVYFNQSLDLPRLVYSTDLSSSDSDLKILARMLNLNGGNGRDALSDFTSANFALTSAGATAPEPATFSLIAGAGLIGIGFCLRRRTPRH
jgi:hypothetical protein